MALKKRERTPDQIKKQKKFLRQILAGTINGKINKMVVTITSLA